jgi:TorA maturation chaperone TorD
MEASARRQFYAFFSRLFVKEVDDAFGQVLKGELGRALLPGFSGTDEPAWLERAEARQAHFDADFAHLALVNLAPHESFFRRPDALVESGAKNPVVVFMQKYGFEADLEAARTVAPDHLGIELELASVLCGKEAEAQQAGDAAYAKRIRGIQLELLREHLLTWAPVYLLAAKRNARTMLYREGADAALEFLLADAQLLANEAAA